MIDINKIYHGDCLEVLKTFPDNFIDCCVTSPPYFGLRDYGTANWKGGDINCNHIRSNKAGNGSSTLEGGKEYIGGDAIYKNICNDCGAVRIDNQIGLEETPELFVSKMVEVFTEVKRVLKNDGTLWLNLGDSYAGSGKGAGDSTADKRDTLTKSHHNIGDTVKWSKSTTIKSKDLIGIPWMVAFALRNSGWYLRQDIIWNKPNPMPESVTDRCTKSHEYIFLMSKAGKYYYDAEAIKTDISDTTIKRLSQNLEFQNGSNRVPGKTNGAMKAVGELRKGYNHRGPGDKKLSGHTGNLDIDGNIIGGGLANKRSVWTVNTMPYSEAHFATFPQKLIVDCIKAGCPEYVCNKCGKARVSQYDIKPMVISRSNRREEMGQPGGIAASGNVVSEREATFTGYSDCGCSAGFSPGIVLDPFSGAGTTALVARKLHRNFIGIELNKEYINISNKRLNKELGMFQ